MRKLGWRRTSKERIVRQIFGNMRISKMKWPILNRIWSMTWNTINRTWRMTWNDRQEKDREMTDLRQDLQQDVKCAKQDMSNVKHAIFDAIVSTIHAAVRWCSFSRTIILAFPQYWKHTQINRVYIAPTQPAIKWSKLFCNGHTHFNPPPKKKSNVGANELIQWNYQTNTDRYQRYISTAHQIPWHIHQHSYCIHKEIKKQPQKCSTCDLTEI